MCNHLMGPLGLTSLIGLIFSMASQIDPGAVAIAIVPTVNLVAIIAGAVSMGMLFNRVRQLERRMDKVQYRVFAEGNHSE